MHLLNNILISLDDVYGWHRYLHTFGREIKDLKGKQILSLSQYFRESDFIKWQLVVYREYQHNFFHFIAKYYNL